MDNINLAAMFLNMQTAQVDLSAKSTSNKGGESFGATLNQAQTKKVEKPAKDNQTNYSQNADKTKKSENTKKTEGPKEKPVSKDKGVVKEETEVEVKDDKKQVVEEEVMALMVQTLELPEEQIISALETLEMTPMDLMQEDQFSEFIGELYKDEPMEHLLSGETSLKDISKLFEDIQALADLEAASSKKLVHTLTATPEVAMENLEPTMVKEIVAEPVVQEMEPQWLSLNPLENNLGETATTLVGESSLMPAEGLGLTLPIGSFTKTITSQNHLAQMTAQTAATNSAMMEQIVEHIDFSQLNELKEIKMQLSPRELGELTIKLAEENGVLTGQISVDSEKVKDFVLNEINQLKQALEEQGLAVSELSVNVRQNESQAQMHQQQQKSSKRIQEIISKHLEEGASEEEEMAPIASETEIDYMV